MERVSWPNKIFLNYQLLGDKKQVYRQGDKDDGHYYRGMGLAYVIGAVGLIQNFGALRALVMEGITKGHMRLHLVNLIKNTDTTPCEYTTVFNHLKDQLCEKRYVIVTDVQRLLKKIRG